MSAAAVTAIRTCPLCEATCGLEIEVQDGRIGKIRGDAQDVFSKGFICPKGASLRELHHDPDRLTTPLRRTASGDFEPVGWDEAFAEIAERFAAIEAEHGRDAFASYLGNPSAHSLSAMIYGRVFLKALRSKNNFSASSVDQVPKQLASGLMFGTGLSVPVPDLDRTMHLLILGADPAVSNGSLMTAPDARGRLRAISARGGKVVVVDPRRSRTARDADEHHFIRPGADALLLLAVVQTLFADGLADPGEHLLPHLSGLGEVRELAAPFTPQAVAAATRIDAGTIRRIAHDLAAAPSAAVYGRIGTTTAEFGTLTSWLVDVVNVLIGGLDAPGGAMFTKLASGSGNTQGEPGAGRGTVTGRWASRVRGCAEVFGELPAACMAEEIDTPGEGRVRALFTIAGNPVLSTPNGDRLAAALDTLELMVSVDIYLNETTRHADFILPAPSQLERSHYDLALYAFAVRNVANYSPAILPLPDGMPDEWQTLLRLTAIAAGLGPGADLDALDGYVAGEAVRAEVGRAGSPVLGRDAGELLAALEPRRGPERILDLRLRTGPFGDAFGSRPDGLTLAVLEANPHGVDLGPLEPRIPEVLRTPSGRIELAPAQIVADLTRLEPALERWGSEAQDDEALLLIGRRALRSNNSWMHNLPKLVSGPEGCTVLVNPADAERLGITDGEPALVTSAAGEIRLTAVHSEDMMPGVISVPHGWGHDLPGARLTVAAEHAGANVNLLGDSSLLEALTGNAVLNGIPVSLTPAREPAAV